MVKKHPLETEHRLGEGAVHLVCKVGNRFEPATPTAYLPTIVDLHYCLIEESAERNSVKQICSPLAKRLNILFSLGAVVMSSSSCQLDGYRIGFHAMHSPVDSPQALSHSSSGCSNSCSHRLAESYLHP